MAGKDTEKLEKIVSLAKRRGFVFQGSEIYGGIRGVWDYGPMGVALKRNIQNLWWQMFVERRSDIFGLDAAILMNERVWEASGHTGAGFADPLVECEKCKKRFRADKLENRETCPECGGVLGDEHQFNLMFQTHIGAHGDSTAYLRPETAQGIFVNFKNVVDSMHPRLPFGIAQIGKAFRNEISPRDFLFRAREFEQMEIEYFIKPEEWEEQFDVWKEAVWNWIDALGISRESVHELEVPSEERAHYSKRTIDFEYDFPFGRDELYGLAYRTDFDIGNHAKHSGVDLNYRDPNTGEVFVPHVIEPTFGVDRTVLAVLASAYREDEVNGEARTYLALPAHIAPIKVAVFPLLKNKPELIEKAQSVYAMLVEKGKATGWQVAWDDNGNIGKRYRRQDEIGTPACVTVDFQTLEDDTVTIRNRNSGEQQRFSIAALGEYFSF